jgi:hypothetical protein
MFITNNSLVKKMISLREYSQNTHKSQIKECGIFSYSLRKEEHVYYVDIGNEA